MIETAIKQDILERIRQAEITHNVRVLYAIESGSRAWGFASPNSDYDVRFVYAHPKEWYLSIDIESQRDVIEYEIVDEIDINGWDIRKALQLLWRSNPSIVEWLQSPIVYVDDQRFAAGARDLMANIYASERGIYHYRSMAKTNYRGYLRDQVVPIKKYFYVLRPLLAVMWIEKYQQPPPSEFARLRSLIPENSDLQESISALLERKQSAEEKAMTPMVPVLNRFIEDQLERLEHYEGYTTKEQRQLDLLNKFFIECIH